MKGLSGLSLIIKQLKSKFKYGDILESNDDLVESKNDRLESWFK